METVTLGRSGLETSLVGLGCGGKSRLGLARGASPAEAVALIHAAFDLGIRFFDTAPAYGTEGVVGEALKGRRQEVVLSTKVKVPRASFAHRAVSRLQRPFTGVTETLLGQHAARHVVGSVEASLKALKTEYLDLVSLHGVAPGQLAFARETMVPALKRLRDEGKIRAIGITEAFRLDPSHEMLTAALSNDLADIVMVGMNFVNPSARWTVLERAHQSRVGVLAMFAVRQALRDVRNLARLLDRLVEEGALAPAERDLAGLWAALGTTPETADLTDIAYRYTRHAAAPAVVLTGTGNAEHLARNVASILAPPLPAPALAELERLFGHVSSVSGDLD